MPKTLPRSIWIDRTSAFAGLMIVAALGGACSSSSTPLSDLIPTTPGSSTKGKLVVSGSTLLTAVGQTTQLSVTDSAGVPLTTDVQWQSLGLGVASVSPSGLVTAVNPGSATIQALTSNAAGSATVFVTPEGSATPRPLTACGAIGSGAYVLTADLPVALGTCIPISNAASVQIDCQGHVLGTLTLTNVGGVSIANCGITRATLSNVTSATIATSAITGPVTVTGSTNVTISDSSVVAAAFNEVQILNTSGSRLLRDTITNTASNASASASVAVLLQNGSNNQVVQCTISGTYNGGSKYNGTDDGILDINEVGDTIQGNTIRNFYDTAVEGVEVVGNLTVADNTFSNIGIAGISSYWCTNWTNSVFRHNDVSASPMLLYTDYSIGLSQCGATSIAGGFSNNQIVGNRFHDPAANAIGVLSTVEAAGGRARTTGPFPRLVVAMRGVVANNLVQGNDLGSSDGPFFDPLAGFIDGGGNLCGPMNPQLSNFACTGSAPSALIRAPDALFVH